jgi:regulator of protease activity HflC (stomatin/prohibitin superfamily)
VEPGELGVKQVVAPAKGLSVEAFGPGIHFLAPWRARIIPVPMRMAVIDLADTASEVTQGAAADEAVLVPTQDGYRVKVEATVLYRIIDVCAVLTRLGAMRGVRDNLVVAVHSALEAVRCRSYEHRVAPLSDFTISLRKLEPECGTAA